MALSHNCWLNKQFSQPRMEVVTKGLGAPSGKIQSPQHCQVSMLFEGLFTGQLIKALVIRSCMLKNEGLAMRSDS